MSGVWSLNRLAAARLATLDRLLADEYRAPEAILANKANPLDEVIYIILSFQTDLRRFKATWRALRSRFPRWEDADVAPMRDIAKVLEPGGLHLQKARTIKRLLRAVRKETGALTLDSLRKLPDVEAEAVLLRLPGLSWKGARCVLLYSLSRDTFPVDSNTFRILRRAGVIAQSAVYRRRSLHDTLQAAVPPVRRKAFHMNLVLHGQRVCLPQRPLCNECCLRADCATGLTASETRDARNDGPRHVGQLKRGRSSSARQLGRR